jgi:hypothetical protein
MTIVARQGDDGMVIDRMAGRLEAPADSIAGEHRVIGVIAATPDQEQP